MGKKQMNRVSRGRCGGAAKSVIRGFDVRVAPEQARVRVALLQARALAPAEIKVTIESVRDTGRIERGGRGAVGGRSAACMTACMAACMAWQDVLPQRRSVSIFCAAAHRLGPSSVRAAHQPHPLDEAVSTRSELVFSLATAGLPMVEWPLRALLSASRSC